MTQFNARIDESVRLTYAAAWEILTLNDVVFYTIRWFGRYMRVFDDDGSPAKL